MKHPHLIASTAAALFTLHWQSLPVVAGQPKLTDRAQVAVSGLLIPSHSHFRAIFCGKEGTETSGRYSRALASDLTRLESAGLSTSAALAHLEQQACSKK